jgi:hypothetical protein
MSLEQFLASINEEDLKRLNEEYYKRQHKIPTYQYSKISFSILKELVDIKQIINNDIFDDWFNSKQILDDETIKMFENLIIENEPLIESYSEEDLKVNYLIPILNKVHFKSYENEFRDFYELPLRYETKDFIFNGATDFVVSKGLIDSEKPYFFIQEFKKGKQNSYPESQLLAELISGVELNKWTDIKGAYVVGSLWFFVILQKIDTNKYQYFVSKKFDGMRMDDLAVIYKNLLYIKSDIIRMVTE